MKKHNQFKRLLKLSVFPLLFIKSPLYGMMTDSDEDRLPPFSQVHSSSYRSRDDSDSDIKEEMNEDDSSSSYAFDEYSDSEDEQQRKEVTKEKERNIPPVLRQFWGHFDVKDHFFLTLKFLGDYKFEEVDFMKDELDKIWEALKCQEAKSFLTQQKNNVTYCYPFLKDPLVKGKLLKILKEIPSLHGLIFKGQVLNSDTVEEIKEILKLYATEIKYLDFTQSTLTAGGFSALNTILDILPSLKTLKFEGQRLEAIQEFQPFLDLLQKNPKIEDLFLKNFILKDSHEKKMGKQLKGLDKLKTLHLNAGDLKGHLLEYLTSLKNLTVLDLSKNNLEALCLPFLKGLTTLHELNLSQNELDNQLVQQLFPLPPLLKSLDLSNNKINHEVVPLFLEEKNITFLNLVENPLNFQGSLLLLEHFPAKTLRLNSTYL